MARLSFWIAAVALVAPAAVLAQENVYNKGLKSTVWIVQVVKASGRTGIRSGSGSVIDAQKRLVLTNYHVVTDNKDATVFFPVLDAKGKLVPERERYMEALRNGAGIPAKVLFTDSTKDLAVIQLSSIPRGVPGLRLAKEGVGPGDRVHSIGSPGASNALFNYTDGSVKSVSHMRIRASAGPNDPNVFNIDARMIETSSSTNKGDSGGPLMNDAGELVGVTQGMKAGDEITRPISYFVDVSEVKALLKAHKVTLSTPAATTVASSASKPADKPAVAPMPKSKKQLEAEAAANLSGAKLFVKSNPKQAREMLSEVIEKFPMTEAAAEAKKLLETLK